MLNQYVITILKSCPHRNQPRAVLAGKDTGAVAAGWTLPSLAVQAASLTVDSCSENQEPGYCTVSNVAISDDWYVQLPVRSLPLLDIQKEITQLKVILICKVLHQNWRYFILSKEIVVLQNKKLISSVQNLFLKRRCEMKRPGWERKDAHSLDSKNPGEIVACDLGPERLG